MLHDAKAMTEALVPTPRVDAMAVWEPQAQKINGQFKFMGKSSEVVSAEDARTLEREIAELQRQLAESQKQLEDERQKVEGCSTAAFGYWKEGDDLHSDYECAAIHDVADIYAKYAALREQIAEVHLAADDANLSRIAAEEERDLFREQLAERDARIAELSEIHRLTWHMMDDSCHEVSNNRVVIDLNFSGEYYNALMEIIGDECPAVAGKGAV